jgi:hypothetical protein
VHCEIYESNGYLVVRDLDSLNGTYVNSQRVTETVLPPGELLTLGAVTFRAVYIACPARGAGQIALPETPSATVAQQESAHGQDPERQGQRESVSLFGESQSDDSEARTEAADVDPEELAQQIRESEEGE